jgi:hypothetical protein
MTTNAHPVDELADVRSRIKALEEREGQLRDELLSGRCGLEGDDHVAQLVSTPRAWVSLKTARQVLGSVLDPFISEKIVRMVRIAAKDGHEGESAE